MMKIQLSVLNCLLSLCFLGSLLSCSYENTDITLGSVFNQPTWEFSNSAVLDFDEDFVSVTGGRAQLKPIDLKDVGDDFDSGTHVGSALNVNLGLLTEDNGNLKATWAPQQDKLLVYYNFEESNYVSGTPGQVLDSGATSLNTGTPNNQALVTSGRVGTAAHFDGTDDYIRSTTQNFLDTQDRGSLSVWIKTHEPGTIASYGDTSVNSSVINWSLQGGGKALVSWKIEGTAGFTANVTGTSDLRGNQWRHLIFVADGTSRIKIYVDGVEEITTYFEADVLGEEHDWIGDTDDALTRNQNFQVGANATLSTGTDFAGAIDELAIYSEPLTPAQVSLIYDRQKKIFASQNDLSSNWTPKWDNIVGYWKMDGHWMDSSSYENNAIPHNNNGVDDNLPVFDSDSKIRSGAIKFDEEVALQYATIANSVSLENIQESSFSMQAWYKPEELPNDTLVRNRHHVIMAKTGFHTGIHYLNNGKFTMDWVDSTNSVQRVSSALAYDPGHYYHLVSVVDLISDEIKIYVDGELTGTLDITGLSAREYGTQTWKIGAGSNSASDTSTVFNADGLIDDVAIWNTALTGAEVAQIYHRQKQKYTGHYDSKVMDLGAASSDWLDISWSTDLPYGKELTGDIDNDGIPDSESSSEYSSLTNSLQSGLVGYWNFNESVADSVSGGEDFQDFSGRGKHGSEGGGVGFASRGKFSRAVDFDGTDDFVDFGVDAAHNFTTGFSIGLWVKIDQAGTDLPTNSYFVIKGTGTHSNILNNSFTFGTVNGANDYILLRVSDGTSLFSTATNGTVNLNNFSPDRWYHLVALWDGSMIKVYVDGKSAATQNFSGPLQQRPADSLLAGVLGDGTRFFDGKMDELALWNRALSDQEILSLYQRGANRLKFQVKSCVDASCVCKSYNTSPVGNSTDCDGDGTLNNVDLDDLYKAQFIGPGGDGATFYSELFHRSSTDLNFSCGLNTSDSDSNVCVRDEVSLKNTPNLTSPLISYSDIPVLSRPVANPYFQYRLFMEADDNDACTGNSLCQPELTSVNVGDGSSSRYYGVPQVLKPSKVIKYTKINSMNVVADDCVTFQLSPDGVSYYYWGGSSWELSTLLSHRTNQVQTSANITSFSSQFGPGDLHLKVFLETDSTQTKSCSIEKIGLKYTE